MRWTLRKPNARRLVWVSLAGLFLAMTAYQAFGARGWLAFRRQLQQEREFQSRVEEMRRQNQALDQRIRDLHDPQTIKQLARQELMLADPGDRIILSPEKK